MTGWPHAGPSGLADLLALLELLDDPEIVVPEAPVLTEAVEDELASAEPSMRALLPLEDVRLRPGPELRGRSEARPARVAGPSVPTPGRQPSPGDVTGASDGPSKGTEGVATSTNREGGSDD